MTHTIKVERLPPEMSGLPAQIRITGDEDTMNKLLRLIEAKE